MFIIPTLRRLRQADHWGSLSIQPSLFAEFHTRKRTCLKTKHKKQRKKRKVGWHLRNDPQGCSLVSTGIFTQMYISYTCTWVCTHKTSLKLGFQLPEFRDFIFCPLVLWHICVRVCYSLFYPVNHGLELCTGANTQWVRQGKLCQGQ